MLKSVEFTIFIACVDMRLYCAVVRSKCTHVNVTISDHCHTFLFSVWFVHPISTAWEVEINKLFFYFLRIPRNTQSRSLYPTDIFLDPV